jgi:phosphatidylglycerophosphate synthase
MPTAGPTRSRVPRAWILEPSGPSAVEIWGLSPSERLRRSLDRAGCRPIQRLGPSDAAGPLEAGRCVLARADRIFDERLIAALVAAPGTLLVDPASGAPPGQAVAACVEAERLAETLEWIREGRIGAPPGLRACAPRELASGYVPALRKYEPPYLHPARPETARRVEELTFDASYKGATDLVTKWVWPRPARAATRWLAAHSVHPNAVTLASWALAIAAGALFAFGWFGTGLAVAWLMTFLDTVDGKLARVTLRSSSLGNVLDHSLDLLHPPLWWFAWGFGVGAPFAPETWIVVLGYLVGRLEEGLFLLAFGMELHCWRPIDALFRTITARRNPNLLLLSVAALGGRADLGLDLVAIWTAVSLAFHAVRIGQAFAARSRGRSVRPFDESAGPAPRPSERAEVARIPGTAP